ncbi:GNAT family N-acetyltransferase [Gracilibacillus caseinilyticus]|uniref:GNAT family N-acetyltransferase n=1 Tax=Gracilibacillus caseinilyticus TaxID=2932256 RepID=A0ABY4EZK0_9BACI|nr:GNAT family N-acetyltransferase [Gracilibacillus caseinilyticus]UOQ49347.1 GNAT family N-acetyltransferase [Gracilibacillus caseinilyticus]
MIRKLSANDHVSVMSLIGHKPAENLFIIGDIEAYGYDADIQELWGQFENEKLIAILLRYEQNYIPFSEEAYDVKGFAEIINNAADRVEISGLKHIIEPLKPLIKREIRKHHETYYAKCNAISYEIEQERLQQVSYLQASEYKENVDMLLSIPEFAGGYFSVEARKRAAEDKTGRTYIVRNEQGTMVASASSTAENSQSAMIVGVGTRPAYERLGYATLCMEKLCNELLAEGKSLCLFYDNPAAGNIYKRLGFEDIGFWTMIRYE